MSDQREFWNTRYAREGYFYGTTPNLYIASIIDTLSPAQNILFLGEGEGRNAAYALRAGHRVCALDASEVGLEKAKVLSSSLGYSLSIIHTDVEEWKPTEKYDAILCSFLHLSEPLRSEVFEKVIKHLSADGIFAGEFFSIHQMPRTTGGPKDETLLYTAEELRTILTPHPCTILELYEDDTLLSEGNGHNGVASIVRLKVQKP